MRAVGTPYELLTNSLVPEARNIGRNELKERNACRRYAL